MIVKASGRPALIVATGLLMLLASPAAAATDEDSGSDSRSATPVKLHKHSRHASHHRKVFYAHRKTHAPAMVADAEEKTAPPPPALADVKALPEIPPSVANANAQMLLAGVQSSAAAAIPAGTDVPAMASDNASTNNGTPLVVAADQLNDVDRSLRETNSQATSGNTPPTPEAATASDNSVWDQTSLIGKIFIGFGALLTMASAARMFMA